MSCCVFHVVLWYTIYGLGFIKLLLTSTAAAPSSNFEKISCGPMTYVIKYDYILGSISAHISRSCNFIHIHMLIHFGLEPVEVII